MDNPIGSRKFQSIMKMVLSKKFKFIESICQVDKGISLSSATYYAYISTLLCTLSLFPVSFKVMGILQQKLVSFAGYLT